MCRKFWKQPGRKHQHDILHVQSWHGWSKWRPVCRMCHWEVQKHHDKPLFLKLLYFPSQIPKLGNLFFYFKLLILKTCLKPRVPRAGSTNLFVYFHLLTLRKTTFGLERPWSANEQARCTCRDGGTDEHRAQADDCGYGPGVHVAAAPRRCCIAPTPVYRASCRVL